MDQSRRFCVARHKETGLYTRGIKQFLWGQQDWIKATNPTVEEVREQVRLANERHNRWTDDLQEAEIWNEYDIKHFGQYAPEVDYVDAALTATEPGANGWSQSVVYLK